jgi:glycosyltransferase involved in cell wall biosynthesis
MRVALFTPLSPQRTALADIIEGLLPYWVDELELTVVTSGSYQPIHALLQADHEPHLPWITYEQFQARQGDFDLVVYNLGDEATLHGYMFDALHRIPGLVFLHDLTMHHAVVGLTLAHSDPAGYLAELQYSYGREGQCLFDEATSGRFEEIFDQHPLIERVLDSSLAVVGYNGYMCQRIAALCPDLPVRRMPLQFYVPDGIPTAFDGAAFRRQLGLEGRPVVASFGLFNTQKRLDLVLRAFKRLLARHPDAVYLLVGAFLDADLRAKLEAMGLSEQVRQTGWQTPAAFTQYMHVVDVAAHLRYPHIGGTPYTPIRLLGLGVPTIISDIEPLAELPADTVVRITPDTAEEELTLCAAMDYLLTHREAARAMATRGQRYVLEHHHLPTIAAQYLDYMREVSARSAELRARIPARRKRAAARMKEPDRLVRLAGEALAELGLWLEHGEYLQPLARALHDLSTPADDPTR